MPYLMIGIPTLSNYQMSKIAMIVKQYNILISPNLSRCHGNKTQDKTAAHINIEMRFGTRK